MILDFKRLHCFWWQDKSADSDESNMPQPGFTNNAFDFSKCVRYLYLQQFGIVYGYGVPLFYNNNPLQYKFILSLP